MANKREIDDIDDGEVVEPETKRPKKHNTKTRQHQNSGIDPTWGQKYVFSSMANATTIPAGEESDFEDDTDAMAYLDSVRQEATGIPHLLVAPKLQIGPQLPGEEPMDRSIYLNGTGDARGWYQDGAYMAKPDPLENDEYDEGSYEGEEDYDEELAIHEAYFDSIMGQYLRLRTILNTTPPPDAHSRLSPSQPTTASSFGRNTSTVPLWSRTIRTTDPHPLQLALMSKDTIISILRILLGGKFLRRGYSLPERTSRWIWALLARLPEKGELNHMEIGWVRDLGRRAVLLGRSLAEMAALREELEEGGLGAHEGVDGSSSDEEVLADAEDLEIEGADSPGDEADGSTSAEPFETADTPHHKKEVEEKKAGESPPINTIQPAQADLEEGEASDSDVAMDLASDSEAEDGEVADSPPESLEVVKARLLAQLDAADDIPTEEELARERSRMNMRATLNMILTIAGEFYGQRDLLEFREPFVGM